MFSGPTQFHGALNTAVPIPKKAADPTVPVKFVPENVTLVIPVQEKKAPAPIVVRLTGNVTLVRLLQFKNASSPIV
jgi:hypothetical protein